MGSLDRKVVVLTGGARGMGAEHVRHLVAEGARVVVGDLLDDEGELLARDLGERVLYRHQDVTEPADWEEMVRSAVDTFGRIDGLVNNAGILVRQPIAEMDLDGFRRVLEVNVTSCWLGIKAVAPVMAAGEGGSIVNISSINGLVGSPAQSAYTASKFAVRGLTKAAAQELGTDGIRVNSVHPGGIATPMTAPSGSVRPSPEQIFGRIPVPRWGQPEEVSPLVAFLLSDQSTYCTGSEYVVDGGALSGTPF
ncbi:SDR family oxidoreductase [Nocardioides sp. BGMRC 2183]|nr:SDR family oxidoreductase [Nocardioides sp. BGMRC 2183]